ncbi:MAG: polymer-forming cytoskeletal protein [Acetatifactor sp.]|jgi:cytoskeletal protein CcmA (bactofilin family)|uniref:polymer-forming cytoskeletal protein n=1 Tax=Acetatifactor sp. TaxID=1872090 RepID=UPI002EB09F86|nr:polymer-forming cytoskeletal protein [Acetatifactor sp.]
MGFFSDLKEDLSQAVNELMPEENLDQAAAEGLKEQPVENTQEPLQEEIPEAQTAEDAKDNVAFEEMLKNLDSIEIPQEQKTEEQPAEKVAEEMPQAEETGEKAAPELDLDSVLQNDMTVEKVLEQENTEKNKGAEKRMDVKVASDETAVITAGMVITGDVSSEGSMDLVGTINGNIDILGKLNITGYINGNSKAAEIFAEGAKINGEILSEGSVKIGASTVVIGNISATSAAIAGAVKGDIDVKGPVILDSSAIVMGNIKSKSVQINNGAVIEGMCSQCYADVSPTSFFDDYKPEKRKAK